MDIKRLHSALNNNSDKFDKLVDFLRSKNSIVDNFHRKAILDLTVGCKNPYEIFYKSFLDSIKASGGSNLTSTANGCRNFLNLFPCPINKEQKLNFSDYCHKIKIQSNTYHFFDYISSGIIQSFKGKKAALFMRNIYYLQDNNNNSIFEDLNSKQIYKPIPVDIVITEILNTVLNLPKINKLNPSKDFHLINTWAKEILKEEYYLIESIWFWGFFNTKVVKNEPRSIEYNDDKFITNEWFYPTKENYIKDFYEFIEIILPSA